MALIATVYIQSRWLDCCNIKTKQF